MSDEQIEILSKTVKTKKVYWQDFEHQIICVRPNRVSMEEHDSEPGPVAYLIRGGYIALWNVEPSDILVIEPLFK